MREVPTGYQLTAEEKASLGIRSKSVPTVAEMQEENLGLGTSIPEYFINTFQELAGERQLNAEDIAYLFRGYLSLAESEEAQPHMRQLLTGLLVDYLRWKRSKE